MPDDIAISLRTAMDRALSDIVDGMASDGLVALKKTLDEAGVSERLKQYQAYSHVAGDAVVFELVVDSDRVAATDPKTMAAIRSEATKLRRQLMERVTKTFELGPDGPRRVVRDARSSARNARLSTMDARSRARDARHPALDARKQSGDSYIENPHGMDMTPDGKLALTLERSTVTGKLGTKFPKNSFQGIMGDFMDRLNDAVSGSFAGELQSILSRRLP